MANTEAETTSSLVIGPFRGILTAVAAALLILMSSASLGQANTLGINLYGISYHILDSTQHREDLNEFNPGLGIRASFGRISSGTYFIEAGFFKDTFKNRARYIASGYMFRMWKQFRVGLNAGIYRTESLGSGGGVLALVPIASYTVKFVTLNVVYLPKYESVNPYHIFATYVTLHLINCKPKPGSK